MSMPHMYAVFMKPEKEGMDPLRWVKTIVTHQVLWKGSQLTTEPLLHLQKLLVIIEKCLLEVYKMWIYSLRNNFKIFNQYWN